MESTINKIFEYFDKEFLEERVEVDEWGNWALIKGMNWIMYEEYTHQSLPSKYYREFCDQYYNDSQGCL